MSSRTRFNKIVLIGAQGYGRQSEDLRIDCYPWQKIHEIQNLQDYDGILINLLPLVTPAAADWPEFSKKLDLSTSLQILRPGGRIIILGDPRFSVRRSYDPATSETPFLSWTGVKFDWDNRRGDTIVFEDPRYRSFTEYVRHLRRWEYSLRRCALDSRALEMAFNFEAMEKLGMKLNLVREDICTNRYEAALIFSIRFKLEQSARPGYFEDRPQVIEQHGAILFLPVVELSEDETITLVLRDIWGIESELPEPSWAARVKVPGQDGIDAEEAKITAQIESLREQVREAETRRMVARAPVKLLYDRGGSLEKTVRETLRTLGAEVEDPKEPGKEDGWIVVRGDGGVLEGVLEVKSTRNPQFGEDALRQLLDWINRGVEVRKKKYKGIFVGSNAVDKPSEERPQAFSDSWRKSAELHQIAAIKSEDLFSVYCLSAIGKLDTEQFWTQLFNTNGIFDSRSYRKALGSTGTSHS